MDDIGGAARCCCSAVVTERNRTREVGTLCTEETKHPERGRKGEEEKGNEGARFQFHWSPRSFSHSVAWTGSSVSDLWLPPLP